MTDPTIRFGYADSIHFLPLLHPLLAGWIYPAGFRLVLQSMLPQELNEALAGGALDGALLDPVALARLRAGFEPLPGVGLSSEGGNGAAVLVSRARADELDGTVIAVDQSAVGGMAEALLKVLLEPYFGINAHLEASSAGVANAGARTGAATGDEQEKQTEPLTRLLAGDASVKARAPWLRYEAQFSPAGEERSGGKKGQLAILPAPDPADAGYATDLGSAWWVLTGTPLVWAIAAVRQELLAQERVVVELVRVFRESRRSAQEQFDTVVAAAAKRSGEPEPVIRTIYAAQRTEITGREHGGLNVFYTHTRRLGITPR